MKRIMALIIAWLVLCGVSLSVLAEDAVSSATIAVSTLPELRENENASVLVVFFSTNDTVKAAALIAAEALAADVFEIVPEQPYTAADLAYYTGGRCDKEQADDSARPGIVNWPESLDPYDVVLIGYPIWHGQAPKILYTFLERIDLSGKTVVPFCTSMSSGAGSSANNLAKLTGETTVWRPVTRISNGASAEDIIAWALSLNLTESEN